MDETTRSRPEYIWIFDENHRVYSVGCGIGSGPIWRRHWVKHQVVGETSHSWLLHGRKVSKKQKADAKYAFSEADIDEQEWAVHTRYKIADQVKYFATVPQLRQIAALLEMTQ